MALRGGKEDHGSKSHCEGAVIDSEQGRDVVDLYCLMQSSIQNIVGRDASALLLA